MRDRGNHPFEAVAYNDQAANEVIRALNEEGPAPQDVSVIRV